MGNYLYYPPLLPALRWVYRLKALVRWRNKDVKTMERERLRFYDWAWRSAARRLGGSAEDLGDDILRLNMDGASTTVWCNFTAIDDPVTLIIARNKTLAYRLLMDAGLPVPRHRAFSLRTYAEAATFLEEAEGACVVKPAKDTGGGLGVTTGIVRSGQLFWAVAFASGYCRDLLIEEQILGDCYRLLYLDGVLLDAIVRHPPALIGDGKSTIRELAERENQRRLAVGYQACQFLLRVDADMRGTLARQGLGMRSVPEAGCKVTVKTVVNENSAEENETVTGILCDEIIEAGARAAQAVGVRLAGVDMMTTDASRPLEKTGGRIMEVNATPGLYYHYYKADGSIPVALQVLGAIGGKEFATGADTIAAKAVAGTAPR